MTSHKMFDHFKHEFREHSGRVYPSSNGTSLTISSGSTARILWTFDDNIQSLTRRYWSFTPRNGTWTVLAYIIGNGPVVPLTSLYDFEVRKPATLILKNVNETYNGAYKFALVPSSSPGEDEVTVFIAGINFVICKTSKDIIFVIFKPHIAKSLSKSFDICKTSQTTFREFSEVGLNVYSQS